jgi:elongation factor Ts
MTERVSHTGEITGPMIKAVRKETRAGTIDCRHALEETGGDIEKAVALLKERGITTPANPRWAHGDYAT